MAIRSQRVLSAFLPGGTSRRPPADRTQTIPVVLAPEAGRTPSDKPPVRIYLGTESAQFRAERAFVWSIARVRDPARRYEIYLMKDFAGFERRLWLTGFTNYRFAIPELAGRTGRAIYNDADQIYLTDPARLFDAPMGSHGVLSINDRDTSVMLIDCEKMAPLWNGASARDTGNRELEARMRAQPGLWGPADGGWNARDAEYHPDRSHLVHYTTIHTQPWRPTPADYVYGANPAGDLWRGIEQEADAAGFQLFGPDHPSPEFAALEAAPASEHARPLGEFRDLVTASDAQSLAYYGFGAAAPIRGLAGAGRLGARSIDTARPTALAGAVEPGSVDVVLADGLEYLPDLDMPWVLDRLFRRAGRAVCVVVTLDTGPRRRCPADPLWWFAQLAAAGRRQPDRHWRLVVRRARRARPDALRRWSGGALLHTPPRTWVLLHYKTGHRSQALGVADALGWRYETRDVRRTPLRYAARAALSSLPFAAARARQAPWPDLIVASGWLPAVIARWISERNHGHTRLVLMGRRGGRTGESEHIGVVCRHFRLPPHPRQLETVLPPNKVAAERLAAARARWPGLYEDGSRPRVALLVGGDSAQHALDADTAAALGRRVRARVEESGGQLAVVTSRRTSPAASRALRAAVGQHARFEAWRPRDDDDNPYLGYLAGADVLVVTGESESMLAEAVATGQPVYICPLPERAPGTRRRLADWVVAQAETDRFNARGSRRPQQGLQYACARLVERRLFVPRRDMPALHEALVAHGAARVFADTLEIWRPPAWYETDRLAQRIRTLLSAAGVDRAAPRPSVAVAPGDERAVHG